MCAFSPKHLRSLRKCRTPRPGFACQAFLLLLVALLSARQADSAVIVVPTSLDPGDQYRLAFVTSNMRNATSGNIDVYNNFVTTAANTVPELVALGTTWRVIASTSAVDARTNTGTDPTPPGPTGVPIFTLRDTKLAIDYDDLWDGNIMSGLRWTESGTIRPNPNVRTGTNPDGTGSAGNQLGVGRPFIGLTDATDSGWINRGTTRRLNEDFPFYAMSDVLTVVPTPSSFVLTSIGVVLLTIIHRRRRDSRVLR